MDENLITESKFEIPQQTYGYMCIYSRISDVTKEHAIESMYIMYIIILMFIQISTNSCDTH